VGPSHSSLGSGQQSHGSSCVVNVTITRLAMNKQTAALLPRAEVDHANGD
jgi:hypothetical protein